MIAAAKSEHPYVMPKDVEKFLQNSLTAGLIKAMADSGIFIHHGTVEERCILHVPAGCFVMEKALGKAILALKAGSIPLNMNSLLELNFLYEQVLGKAGRPPANK
eukprot:4440675-Alexandrium_andersonii.AAC.1